MPTDRFDSPMYHDPEFRASSIEPYFPEGLGELWLQALQQSETELQVKAADAFARAHGMGMEVSDEVSAKLRQLFRDPSTHPLTREATARALVQLDDSKAADAFHEAVDSAPLALAQIIEPALAKWKHSPTVEIWRARLSDASTSTERLVLAIRGVAGVKDEASIKSLGEIVRSDRSKLRARLMAASALAELSPDDNEALASELLESDESSRISRLLAARVMESTSSTESIELLLRLASDPEPAVALGAQRALWRIDPAQLFPLIGDMSQSRDPGIRELATRVLGKRADEAAVTQLVGLLEDRHPSVRASARNEIESFLNTDQFISQIWDEVETLLSKGKEPNNWRSLEQAMLLTGRMNHQSFAMRLLPYLKGRRSEVKVTAAWALRTLDVKESYAEALAYCQSVYDNREEVPITLLEEEQLGHLFQMFGRNKYWEAEPLQRSFIPKDMSLGLSSRLGAIWALGYLHEDSPDEELARQIVARLNDRDSLEPEPTLVRQMCASALGRMRCESQLPSLRESVRLDDSRSPLGYASAWAIHRITGEPLPEPVTLRRKAATWFLEPL